MHEIDVSVEFRIGRKLMAFHPLRLPGWRNGGMVNEYFENHLRYDIYAGFIKIPPSTDSRRNIESFLRF